MPNITLRLTSKSNRTVKDEPDLVEVKGTRFVHQRDIETAVSFRQACMKWKGIKR